MKLIESFIQSKTGRMEACEDTYFVNEHFAAVIDGATSVSDRLYDGKTQGQLAAETLRNALEKLKGQESILEMIDVINRDFEQVFHKYDLIEEVRQIPHVRPSASMIIFSKYHRKIWFVGDCQCIVDGVLHQNTKRVDEVFSEARSIVVQAELISGKSQAELMENDLGFQLIRPLIQKQYYFQNLDHYHPLSYATINGFPVPEELIKTVDVPNDTQEIILASDGYPKIFCTLEESETELERLMKIDPLCIHENMSTKGLIKGNVAFDDRTYLRIKL